MDLNSSSDRNASRTRSHFQFLILASLPSSTTITSPIVPQSIASSPLSHSWTTCCWQLRDMAKLLAARFALRHAYQVFHHNPQGSICCSDNANPVCSYVETNLLCMYSLRCILDSQKRLISFSQSVSPTQASICVPLSSKWAENE